MRNRDENIKLCNKYPFLRPKISRISGMRLNHYDYEWTWADEFPEGWYKAFGEMMLDELKACLEKADFVEKFEISQIKEKYGSLRFYYNGAPTQISEELYRIVTKYEVLSENICIECGEPDVPYTTSGWITPICLDCYRKTYRCRDLSPEEQEEQYKKDTEGCDSHMDAVARWTVYKQNDGKEEVEIHFEETAEKIRKRYVDQGKKKT